MKHGLSDNDLSQIIKTFAAFKEIREAILFGSRAKGNSKTASDVDIAIKGKEVSHKTVTTLSDQLNEESLIPYYFDVVDYSKIENKDLKKHIDRVGIIIYQQISDNK